MNVVNPEALVARTNLARAEQTGRLDVSYLQGLSTDAVPAVVADAPGAVGVLHEWCSTSSSAHPGLSWNWSRQRAQDLLYPICR